MTALDDLNVDVAAIDTAEAFDAAFADPDTRWYALRRRPALIAAGILAALTFEALHPRGRDGKFIEKWGVVRWFDKDSFIWRQGIVRSVDVDPVTGKAKITVANGKGDLIEFNDPKSLIARPKPKARMVLPDPLNMLTPGGFKKTGSQAGSNPGGFYEVVDANAALPGATGTIAPPDIARGNRVDRALKLIAEGPVTQYDPIGNETVTNYSILSGDTVVVPRLDGTPNRYDTFVKVGTQWYRVPATGSLTDSAGNYRTDLVTPATSIWGVPGSPRRAAIMQDSQPIIMMTRRDDVSPNDVVSTVQQAASTSPVVGDRFYVKTMDVPERARNEALANDLYEMVGIAVPEVSVGASGDTVASKLIGEHVDFDRKNPAHLKGAQQGFVFDAWLANWDAVGKDYDNMQVGPDGTVWRIDAGGALKYRAMGKPKGPIFGADVGELDSLRDASINPQAASVYGGITDSELHAQGEMLRAISPQAITNLADTWDMPDVAPVLIARRKSILDKLGITEDIELDILLSEKPQATSVYNPAEDALQPGTAPQVAVHNFDVAIADLAKTPVTSDDVNDADLMQNAVHVGGGDVWVYVDGYTDGGLYAEMNARSLSTGETQRITIWPGDEVLTNYTADTGTIDFLADDLKVQYDLGVAQVADDSMKFDSITAAMNDLDWKLGYSQPFQPYDFGVGHVNDVYGRIGKGQLKPDGPLYNTDTGLVYEIVKSAPDGITLRESGTDAPFTVTQQGFINTGPWRMAGNPSADAVYRARLKPAAQTPAVGVAEKAAIEDALPSTHGEFGADLTDDSPYPTVSDAPADTEKLLVEKLTTPWPGSSAAEKNAAYAEYDAAMNAHKDGKPIPPTPTLDKLSGLPPADTTPDTVVVEQVEVTTVEAEAVAIAGPTVNQQIDPETGLLTALGPGDAWKTADVDPEADLSAFVGTNVIVMDAKVYENPNGLARQGMNTGLIKVESVDKTSKWAHWLNGVKADGTKVTVRLGSSGMYHDKYVIPVAADPVPMPLSFKGDGTIMSGKRKVGVWYGKYEGQGEPKLGYAQSYTYRAIIDANESVTGKPLILQESKKTDLRSAVFGLTRPVAPPPVKPKKQAAQKTEAEIAKLKQDYIDTHKPSVSAQVSTEVGKQYVAVPEGQVPLADGSLPVVGQWVYSPKDNTWWQVVQTDPKLTGKVAGTNLRVRRKIVKPDGTSAWKESFRGRSTMYAVDAEHAPPKVFLAANVVTLSDGNKAGPGMYVWWPNSEGSGALGVRIVETKGGKVKIVTNGDGEIHWVGSGDLETDNSTPDLTVLTPTSTADIESLIEAKTTQTLNEAFAEMLAADLAAAPPKKVKAAVTYPGPGGTLVKQDPVYAENRLAKGQKVLADGFAPMFGQVLRHKDGTRYVVLEVGEYGSKKDQVRVIAQGASVSSSNAKWRTVTTLVVDHEAMLTDSDGDPLPRLGATITGDPDVDVPDGSFIFRHEYEKSLGYDVKTHTFRHKIVTNYYAVAPDGKTYDMATGKLASNNPSAITFNGSRVAVVDKAAGNQTLVMTLKDDAIVGFTVVNPGTDPTALIAGKTITPPTPAPPAATPGVMWAPVQVGDPVMTANNPFPATVIGISGDQVAVQWEDGSSASLPVAEVQPEAAGPIIIKDGLQFTVGQGVTTNGGVPVTITSIDPVTETATIQFTDGSVIEDYSFSKLKSGMSAPNTTLPAPALLTYTLSDGTILTPGDKVTINGNEATVKSIGEPDEGFGVEYPDGVLHWIDPDADQVGSVQAITPTPAPSPPTPTPTVTTPNPPPPPASGDDLTGDLPPFNGTIGSELTHPKTTSNASGVPTPPVTGQTADLTDPALQAPGVQSVMGAVAEAQARVAANKSKKHWEWPVAYGLGDSDLVEDMQFHTQVARDATGKQRIQVTFRLEPTTAKATRDRLLTSKSSEYGDWTGAVVDPKNLVPGDQIAVKVSGQNATQLKPNENGIPNAVITAGPTLVGKGLQDLDVYRVEVAFNNGDTGVLELLSGHSKPFYRYTWDPQKVRTSNGSTGLNPNAIGEGWSTVDTSLNYPKASGNLVLDDADGVKQPPTGVFTVEGSGSMLRRDVDGTSTMYWTAPSKNTMDGQVTITVDAEDPDAQAKISAAMEAVGVPPDKQVPSREALVQMALEKVFTQFSPTYVRGQKSNATPSDPSQVLAMMDKEIGSQLGRKVTMHDLSLRTNPDGRVQVLLSPDVAKAISQRNGAKMYRHEFIKGGSDAMFMVLSDQTPGLLSSNERFNSGLFFTGYSSAPDHEYDSADRVYMRASTSGSVSSGSDRWSAVVDSDTVHRMVDTYWRESDSMGARDTAIGGDNKWLALQGGGSNELMVKRRVETEVFGQIIAPSDYAKTDMIKRLTGWGMPKAPNGQDWDTFITVGTAKKTDLATPDFGHEVPLDALL